MEPIVGEDFKRNLATRGVERRGRCALRSHENAQ